MVKQNIINKYASLSLILGPFIEPYAITDGGTAMYKFFMLFNIFLFWNKGTHAIIFPKMYKQFLLYALLVPTLVAFITGYISGLIGSFFALLLFTINIVLVVPLVRVEYIKKYYRIAVYLCIIVFITQEVMFYISGIRFMALIPFFHTVYKGVDMASFVARMSMEGRSCSMFLEPSHFAHFLLPYLAMTLGILHDKKKLLNIDVIVVTIVLVFLRSGNGLLVLAIIWAVAILFSSMNKIIKYVMIIPFSLFVAIYGFSAFSDTEMGQSVLERTEELDTDFTRVSSGFIRVWRGYYVYDDQPDIVKLFGVGYGGIEDAVHKSNYQWMFKSNDDIYVNNVQAFLLSYGIFGSFLYLLFLFCICKKEKFATIMMVVTFLSLCFLDNFFCSTKMLLILAIPLAYNNYNIRKEKKLVNTLGGVMESLRFTLFGR